MNRLTRLPVYARVKLRRPSMRRLCCTASVSTWQVAAAKTPPQLDTCDVAVVHGHGVRIGEYRGVYWRKLDYTSFRRTRAYRLNRYHRMQDSSNSYYIDLDATEKPRTNCGAENVINGVSRALSPDTYAWVSDPSEVLGAVCRARMGFAGCALVRGDHV